MDINQKLLQRKLAKKKQKLNKILKIKKKFKNYQKYQENETNDKLMNDPLAEKKLEFYEKVFNCKEGHDEFADDRNDEVQRKKEQRWLAKQQQKQEEDFNPKIKIQKNIEKNKQQDEVQTNQKDIKSNRQKKLEKNLVKRIFKEKTKKGQPVMKNIIDYVVHKLEKEKKTK